MSISIQINSVDVTDEVLMGSVSISDQINQRTNTLTFKTEKYGTHGYKPELNDQIEVFHDGNKIFGGVIISYTDDLIGHNTLRYSIKAKDYAQYLDRKLVTKRYEDETLAFIVDDLVDIYTTGFTSTVTSTQNIASISFNRLTMSECLQKLANALNFVWWVDYDKNVHMIKKNEQSAPFGLSDASENHITGTLSIEKDISQIRNIVVIEGGDEVSEPVNVEYHGDGEQIQFDTMYKFAEMPTLVVDGVTQTIGLDNIADPLSFDYMWSYNEKYVKANSTAPTYKDPSIDPPNVIITGKPLFPILVRVPEPVSIGTYGEYEYAITDRTIRTKQQGIDRAVAELQAYGKSISEGGFTTYKFGIESGQTINVSSAIRGINENFIIQRVSTKFVGIGGGEIKAEYQVEFATLKTVGIIELLQKLLLDEEITEGELDVLLTYLQFEDSFTLSDDDISLSVQIPPYKYDSDGTTSTIAKWNYSTWA